MMEKILNLHWSIQALGILLVIVLITVIPMVIRGSKDPGPRQSRSLNAERGSDEWCHTVGRTITARYQIEILSEEGVDQEIQKYPECTWYWSEQAPMNKNTLPREPNSIRHNEGITITANNIHEICNQYGGHDSWHGEKQFHDLSNGPISIKANGKDHYVCAFNKVPGKEWNPEEPYSNVILEGDEDGSLILTGPAPFLLGTRKGKGTGTIVVIGRENDAIVGTREGSGEGNAVCAGLSRCMAFRRGIGNGDAHANSPFPIAIREGQGTGDAIGEWHSVAHLNKADGYAACNNTQGCYAILQGDIGGLAVRSELGFGCAYGSPGVETRNLAKTEHNDCKDEKWVEWAPKRSFWTDVSDQIESQQPGR